MNHQPSAAGEAADESPDSTGAAPGLADASAGPHKRRHIDPAMAASVAAGAAWLAGKGVHRVRKRRVKSRGGARTRVGGHVSNVIWTVLAAAAAALVEVVVGRLLKRNRGK